MAARTFKHHSTAIAVATAFGVVAAMGSYMPEWLASTAITSAQAQDGSAKGGPSDRGSRGSKAGDAGSSGSGQGQGGPSSDSDAKGPRFGGSGAKPAPGTQGGKPVWAQEGVPSDLELGRLSVVRAPSHVLDRSLAEALSTLSPKFYDAVLAIADNAALTMDQKLVALQTLVKSSFTDTTMVRIDSPLQNLGLYKDVIVDGKIVATAASYDASSSTTRLLLLAAVFVGSASDKTIPVTTATVDAITKIMTLTLPAGLTAAELAKWSEAVRVAIAEAHG